VVSFIFTVQQQGMAQTHALATIFAPSRTSVQPMLAPTPHGDIHVVSWSPSEQLCTVATQRFVKITTMATVNAMSAAVSSGTIFVIDEYNKITIVF
jgi:hypothetical protein